MPWQDVQQVCLNGHQITDNYNHSPLSRKNFCTLCGEKTVINCVNCKNSIPGATHYENVFDLSGYKTPIPNICQYCGNKFPWHNQTNKKKSEVLNKNLSRGFSFKKIIVILGILSTILAIITDGFQVWGNFKNKETPKSNPVINIKVNPISINYSEENEQDKLFYVEGKIEIGNGIYKFTDKIKINSLKIIDSSYFFFDEIAELKIKLKKITFDKMILGNNIREQKINLLLQSNYILKGDKTIELHNLKSSKLIASVDMTIPYYFEGFKFKYDIDLPIFIYYK